jgi:hypothetical protein
MRKAKPRRPLAKARASATSMRNQAERLVIRLRRDAQALIARSRGEVVKEIRDLERRVVKGFHAATEEQVARLERRVAKLESLVAELAAKAAGPRADQAA